MKVLWAGGTTQADVSTALTAGLMGTVQGPAVSPLDDEGRLLFQLAPNAIEWVTDSDFANSPSLFEYFKSYQTIRDYFELRCPICNPGTTDDGQPGDCWGRSRTYLESEVLLRWSQDDLEDVCPKCKTTRSEFIEDGIFRGYNQLHLVVGKRAGKSMTAALMGTYAEHVIYTIAHTYPGGFHGYFGITPAEKFEMTFLASNQISGQDTIWAKYTGFRTNSPWFRRYASWIGTQEKAQPAPAPKMRRWSYSEDLAKIENEHPNVRLVIATLNSNSSGQVGRTRVHGFIDELDYLLQGESRLSSTEVYRAIEGQLRTIRSRAKAFGGMPWFGSMVSVSSPRDRGGKALELYHKSPEIPQMYARKFATWEYNPFEPRENFDGDYAKDPGGAERDFGANPPGAEHPLVHDEARWATLAIDKDLKSKAEFEYTTRRDPLGQSYVAVKLRRAERMFDRKTPRYVVFDAGKNFDCFAGACAHGEWRVGADKKDQLVTVYDWVFRIIPLQETEIWFASVVALMKDLKKTQYTAFVAFDHWNSVQLIQDIRDLGIPAEQEPLPNKDFLDWNANSFEGIIRMIAPDPIDLKLDKETGEWAVPFQWTKKQALMQPSSVVIAELLELQRDPDSDKVYNPHKGEERGEHSDDLARVAVHVHRNVQRAGFSDKFDDRSSRAARRRAEHEGAGWGVSRGGVAKGPPRPSARQTGRGW